MGTIEPLLKKLEELYDYSQEAFDEVTRQVILYRHLAEKDPEEFLHILKETSKAFEEERDALSVNEVRHLLGGSGSHA